MSLGDLIFVSFFGLWGWVDACRVGGWKKILYHGVFLFLFLSRSDSMNCIVYIVLC
jgi:hypothetical protein